MVKLRKVWTSDRKRIVRAAFTEDLEYVRGFASLDAAVNSTMDTLVGSGWDFYRVENQSGSIVGFIAGTLSHIRPQFRTPDYLTAFNSIKS